ncbi:hypothetical protein ACFC06_24575 [Nocardia sp. NPDC056064]|uniref:hypothetical protein n=1 Tax=Nocardia sp. NPDC056064 TaxID=3345701 RepID=UPI0035DC0976
MTDLLTHGQLTQLTQTLEAGPDELAGLARLGADDLRVLRERLSGLLFDADEPVFARLSKLSPLVPTALLVKIAVSAIPPEVAGRAGGSLGIAQPDRVAEVLSALPATYLADAAPHLDPRTVAALAPRLSGGMLIPTAVELLRRQDYITAGRFIEFATDALVDDLEQGISDDVGLLRTVATTADSARLDEVVRRLPAARQETIVRAAATGTDETLLAALSVLARVGEDLRARLATVLVDALDQRELDRLVTVAARRHALAELFTALAATDTAIRSRVAEVIAAASTELSTALTDAASTDALRGELDELRALRS